jgi:Ca2+-binding EF-hand superfamily protein
MISGIGQLNWTSGTTATSTRPSPAEMFAKMDTNGDGSVDKAEFTAFGKQMAAKMGKADKSEEIFAKIDTDADGKISQAENDAFISKMQAQGPQGGPPPDGAKGPDEMFAKMDTNGDNSVDKAEFETFFQQMANKTESTDESSDLFSQIDTDGDGKISKSESSTFAAKMESQMQSMLASALSTLSNTQQSSASDTSTLYDVTAQRYAQSLSASAQSSIDLIG